MTRRNPDGGAAAVDLREQREELRNEIREAHEVLKDLRTEIREARTLVPLLAKDLFEAEVKKQLAALTSETKKAMDASVDRVAAKFDELFDLYMRGSRSHRRAGEPSLIELLEKRAMVDDAAARREMPGA
jgi:predicted nuclease with TOPRIM domain